MKLHENKTLIDGEVIIDFPIIINERGVIEDEIKDIMKKCPHCCVVVGKDFSQHTDEEVGKVEISFSCTSCNKGWIVRFKKPFRKVLL